VDPSSEACIEQSHEGDETDVDAVKYEYNATCRVCGWVGDASSATEKCPVCWSKGKIKLLDEKGPR
jgi:rubrerythrin